MNWFSACMPKKALAVVTVSALCSAMVVAITGPLMAKVGGEQTLLHMAASAASPCPSLRTSGLVGHWRLDEGQGTVTNDSTTVSGAGTLMNGTAWSANVPATQFTNPRSLSFDGVDDYVN